MTSAAYAVLTRVMAADPTPVDPFGSKPKVTCASQNKTFCWDWFGDNWSRQANLLSRLIEHVELTAIAVAIGFVIAFVLAVAAHRFNWLTLPVTFLGSLLYTIPSLAAFVILLPYTGINNFTVELALVSYTLLILFTNILAGLSNVPPDVLDAARGSGLKGRQILFRVEVPLAMPTIIAGIRVAVVTIVSLATVAGLLVPQGLGAPIQDALQGDFKTEFIAAGVLCVVLALVLDALLAGGQRLVTPWASARRIR